MIYSCLIDFIRFMPSLHAYYVRTYDTAFDAYFLIRIYRSTCTYLCTPLGFHLATRWGVSDSLELACSDSEAWIEVEPSAEDQAYLSKQAD